MPTPAPVAPKVRAFPKSGVKTRLQRLKKRHPLIRPADLQAQVVETVQRLQNFHQSLEMAEGTYTPRRLQRISEKLTAIYDQSKHLPKFQAAIYPNGHLAELEGGPVPAKLSSLPTIPVQAAPRTLSQLQALVGATADLRAAGGNLSADAVAAAFGVSLNQLAGWLGRTRQALSKTPDADSLQDNLAAFEQVARLRTVLAPDAFRKWLRMPNRQLDGTKPLDLLATGRDRSIVAGLVEDMLTGMPT